MSCFSCFGGMCLGFIGTRIYDYSPETKHNKPDEMENEEEEEFTILQAAQVRDDI